MKIKLLNATFLKFLIVGGLGLILNFILFFLLADILKVDPNWAAVLAFVVCVTHNYILNHFWSFKNDVDYPPTLQRYLKFLLVYSCGLIVNIIVLNILLFLFHPEPKVIADFFAAISSVLINFVGTRSFVFPQNRTEVVRT